MTISRYPIILALTLIPLRQASAAEDQFRRLSPSTQDPNGNSVETNCGGSYLDAAATLQVAQTGSATRVHIKLRNARPYSLYTVWLRLQGADSDGNLFGGSPLTNAGSTPLAPSSELGALLAATGPGSGTTRVANGLTTDRNGNGELKIELDFPFIGGAYPFQKFPDFNPADPRFPISNPRALPVAIVIPDGNVSAPFALRVVSHCLDDVGHGLEPGNREPWFDWP